MASLLDLTVQGDVGTLSDSAASRLPQIKLMEPLELYRLWERQSWASHPRARRRTCSRSPRCLAG
jgi:hypothetical protein